MVRSGFITIFQLIAFLSCLTLTQVSFARNQIIESIMRSDFIFDKNITNSPFIPMAYVYYNQQNDLILDSGCTQEDCSFDYETLSQGFAMPVWVGQKNMLLLGETIDLDTVHLGQQSLDIDSAGLLAAWIAQPTEQWQAGAFIYSYKGISNDSLTHKPEGNISGVIARYRHSPKFHSYWGIIRIDENDDELVIPYMGFDWFINQEWSIGGVMPWPTVNYAPSQDRVFRVGALMSGSEWAMDVNGEVINSNFQKWDVGFSYEQRMWKMLWGAVTVGYSGLGSVTFSSDSDKEFETDIESSPFIRLSLNFRFD